MPLSITSTSGFIDHLKKRLGNPIVRICDVSDDQIEICICNSVERFQEFATGEAQYESMLKIAATSGVSEYDVDSDITAAVEVITCTNFGRVGQLFTLDNHLYNAGYFNFDSGDILTLQMVMDYVDFLKTQFGTTFNVKIDERRHKALVNPTPKGTGTLAFIVTRKNDETTLYSHIWVREYAYALCMVQIGMNRSKYEGVSLPGGGTLNGQLMLTEGKELRDKLDEELRTTWQTPPDFYIA